MILEVSNLHKTYPANKGFGKQLGVKALRGIHLQLTAGETLAVVGESGCGKSTLAKVLLKIESPSEGKVNFEGQNLEAISQKELSSFVQMVFQDPYSSLNPRRKIFDIIGEPLFIRNIAVEEIRKRVQEVITQVGLRPEIIERYPHMLSGGQRQRVGIARALITKPKLIICDEPVSALDVSVQGQVLNLLLDLQKEFGLTYLFISHDLGVVRFIADRVAVMYLGQIVEVGSSHDIFSNPQHPYTQLLLQSSPDFEGPIRDDLINNSEIPSPLNPPSGCGFHTRCAFRMAECSSVVPKFRYSKGMKVACHLYKGDEN